MLEAAILDSYAAMSNLGFRGVRAPPSLAASMKTTIRAWREATAIYRKPSHVSPHTPLWGNPMLPHLNTIPDPSPWAKKRITTLKHVIVPGKLMRFQEMRSLYSVPRSFECRYWQLLHAIGAQFTQLVALESDSIERLLTSSVMGKPLSSLYLYLTVA